jgi:hypothetical protein
MTRSRVLPYLVAVLVLMLNSATSTLALASHSGAEPTTDPCFLTITVTGCGTVVRNPNTGCGQVQITVVPCDGWHFIGWSGDFSGSANPISLYLSGNKSITANLSLSSCTLALDVVGNGTVTSDPAPPACGPVQLTATPAAGWHFLAWSGDVSGASNPLTFSLGGNKAVTANFAMNTRTLDVTVLGGGTVARNPDLPSYDHGAIVELTATPAPGDAFAGWSGDASGASNPLMVTMDGDKSITASFGLLGAPGRGASELALGAISPTPTSGPARIAFALPREAHVRLTVIDLQGREVATVADATYPAGRHEAAWSGRGSRGALPAGVYALRMQALGHAFVRRVVVTR